MEPDKRGRLAGISRALNQSSAGQDTAYQTTNALLLLCKGSPVDHFSIMKTYRKALPEDASACIALRGRTRENTFSIEQLRALGITSKSWAEGIEANDYVGHVCCKGDEIIGYCFGDRDSGEIIVLALLPEHEGRGVGKTLLNLVIKDLKVLGHKKLRLGCTKDPTSRSHGFYRHLGWISTGETDTAGDEILELTAF